MTSLTRERNVFVVGGLADNGLEKTTVVTARVLLHPFLQALAVLAAEVSLDVFEVDLERGKKERNGTKGLGI